MIIAMRGFRSVSVAVVLLLAVVTACSDTAPRPAVRTVVAEDTTGVRGLEEKLTDAMVEGDTVALSGLLASEYISTSAVGHSSNRAETLMAYAAGLVNVDSARVRDVEVRPYGGTVVSMGLLDWGGSAAGHSFSSTVRFLHVWVFAQGAWRLVASQLTNQ